MKPTTNITTAWMLISILAPFITACDQDESAESRIETMDRVALIDIEPPTVPSDFYANRRGPNAIFMEWNSSSDNRDILGYEIFRNGLKVHEMLIKFPNETEHSGPIFESAERNAASEHVEPRYSQWEEPADRSYYDKELEPLTEYCYQITAFDSAGNRSEKTKVDCETTSGRNVDPGVSIFPGVGAADLEVGQTISRVIERFGEGFLRSEAIDNGYRHELHYKLPFEFRVIWHTQTEEHSLSDVIETIAFDPWQQCPWYCDAYEGTTEAGIKLWSPMEDVFTAYGVPSSQISESVWCTIDMIELCELTTYQYAELGVSFLFYQLPEDYEPVPAMVDAILVHEALH